MASDFHTHNQDSEYRALISSNCLIPGKFTSLSFHPWELPDTYDENKIFSPEYLQNFAALGEIGLDKLHLPALETQQKYFHALLSLASDCNKPVVIHCVRSFQELFAALKPFDLKVLFHGFRSSAEMLDELWKRNMTVSFHYRATSDLRLMKKLASASGKFGFESDDDTSLDIREIISGAEKTSGMKNLERLTDQFFADFLEI